MSVSSKCCTTVSWKQLGPGDVSGKLINVQTWKNLSWAWRMHKTRQGVTSFSKVDCVMADI